MNFIRAGVIAFLAVVIVACGGSPNQTSDTLLSDVPVTVGGFATCLVSNEILPKTSGLPQVSGGKPPGPGILYQLFSNPSTHPILQNHDALFQADPIMVQGQEAYVNGEYLYQDFIFDDYGSDVSNDDFDEAGPNVGNNRDLNGLEPRVGDIDYPTNVARYGGNAADLLEFRIVHGISDVTYRITLNTLLEPDSTIISLVFDMDNDPLTGLLPVERLPRDPGTDFAGADEVIDIWGTGAEHSNLNTGSSTGLLVTTRLDANQMWVTVPRSTHNPTGEVGVVVATGVYDVANDGWMMPASAPTETQPGAVKDGTLMDPNPAGIFNLAFRFDEFVASNNTPPDAQQSRRIREKNPNAYKHIIDFDDLATGVNRNSTPATGTQVRLFASSFSLNQDGSRSLDHSGEGRNLANNDPVYLGPIQPYSIFIPDAASGTDPLPLHWAFHSNNQQHWQYNGSRYVQQIGNSVNAFVPTTMGRGPRNWYDGPAELDVFEVWADIARHFNIDSNRTASTGYSMGGFATYRFGTLYPDLFGKAFSQVGPPGELIWIPPGDPSGGASTLSNLILENTRNLPYLNIVAIQDQLVPYTGPQAQNVGNPGANAQNYQELNYRYRFLSVDTAEHFSMFLIDDYPFASAYMADTQVNRNPYHVTFSYLPAEDDANYGLVHNHAYWVSDLALVDSSDEKSKGTADLFSHACGQGLSTGITGVDAGLVGPLSYNEVNNSWSEPAEIEAENKLTITLTNLAQLSVDVPRSGVDASASFDLDITSDNIGQITLTGDFSAGTVVTKAGSLVGNASVSNTSISFDYDAEKANYLVAQP